MIDTHTHYDHELFNTTREKILTDCHNSGIEYMINAAISFETNKTMREKLSKYPWISYGIGIHPSCVGETDEVRDAMWECEIRKMADESGVVAIGETGLDYHNKNRDEVNPRQTFWFKKLLSIAEEKKLPVILHIREADEDGMEILKEFSLNDSGVVHCFKSDWKAAQFYLDKGLYLGIGGAVTHPKNIALRDAVQKIPLDRIVLETDAPYVKPLNCQSEVNTSLELPKVVQVLSELKGISCEEIIGKTTENAKRLFQLENV